MFFCAGIIFKPSPESPGQSEQEMIMPAKFNFTALAFLTVAYVAVIAGGVIARVEPARQALFG